ncbi:MAG: acetyl-CoA carboxylase biotin carboxyl carrier protein [Planctomycetota bacterium]
MAPESRMIDVKKLRTLVELMVDNDLTEVDLESEGERVSLRRGAGQAAPVVVAPAAAPAAVAPAAPAAPAAPTAAVPEAAAPSGPAIESPMVGTFYASSSPDSPPFVKAGDTVTADTVVCIVEAMKVFNEIKAETAGVIDAVLVESGDAVEFGQPMFRLRS